MKPVADLCDLYSEKLRILPPIFKSLGGHPSFYGSVVTIKAPQDNSKVSETLETEGLGRVLVIDGEAAMDCALLGDRLAELAVRNGWAGVVVNGCIRDSRLIASMPVGVKALGCFPRKTEKKGRGEVNCKIQIGSVEIKPGDYLYADDDGVIISSEILI